MLWRAGFIAAVAYGGWLLYGVLLANAANLKLLAAHGPSWWFLGLATAAYCANQMIVMGRWLLVARAAGVAVRVRDAIALGVAGEAGSLVMPGANGGDAVKVGMMLRAGLPVVRLTAASVADRVAGLIGLLIVGVAAGLSQWGSVGSAVRGITMSMAVVLAVCLTAVVLILQPPAATVLHAISRAWPMAKKVTEPLAAVAQNFRRRAGTLCVAVVISVLSQSFSLLALYLSSRGLLQSKAAGVLTTFLAGPLVLVSTVLPLPFGALGVMEQVGQDLFESLGSSGGGLATLGYRLSHTMAVIALVGCYGAGRWLAPQLLLSPAEAGNP